MNYYFLRLIYLIDLLLIIKNNNCYYQFVLCRMEEGADMHSLLMTDNNTLLMGGLQNYVAEVDLNTVQETQKVRHWNDVYQQPHHISSHTIQRITSRS